MYSVKHRAIFYPKGGGKKTTVELLKDGYDGAVQIIKAYGDPPLRLDTLRDNKEDNKVIIGSSVVFRFVVSSKASSVVNELSEYDDLINTEYKKWKLRVKEDDVLIWEGLLQPDQISHSFIENKFIISLSATDGLKDLKDIPFTYSFEITKEETWIPKQKLINIIRAALLPIGISLDFKVQLNLRHEEGSTDDNCLTDTFADIRRFENDVDGVFEYDSCHKVIEKVLTSFNCTLRQSGGYYHIRSRSEKETPYWDIAWGLHTSTKQSAIPAVELVENYQRGGELSKITPVGTLNLYQMQRRLGESILDYDINDFNNWSTNFPEATVLPDDSLFVVFRDEQSEQLMDVFEGSIICDPVTISQVGELDYLRPDFHYKWVFNKNAIIKFRVGLYHNGQLVGNYSNYENITSADNSYRYDNFVNFPISEPGDYQFKIEFQITVGDGSGQFGEAVPFGFIIYLWGFDLMAVRGNDLFDVLRIAKQEGKRSETIELWFSDSPGIEDLNGFKYAIGPNFWPTTLWKEGTKLNELPLTDQFIINYLRINSTYRNYVSFTIYSDIIKPSDLIKINSTYYKISSYSYDFLNKKLSLVLSEFIEVEIFYEDTLHDLLSIDGMTFLQGITLIERKKIPQAYVTAHEAEVEEVISEELESIELITEPANEADVEVVNEADVVAAHEADIEVAKEAEIVAAREADVEVAKEADVEVAKEAEVEIAKEADVTPAHEAEVEEVISEELESVELITEPANEAEVEVAKEAEVIPAREADIEVAKEADVEVAKDADVEVAREADVVQAHEASVEVAKEADVVPAHEATIEVANEAEVIPAHEASVEVANEAEVIPAHEAEVEELESVELITEPANEADVEVANEAEVIPAHEADVEVANEAEVIPAHEASIEVANEAEVIPAHEAATEVTNEAEVIPAHEASIEVANESEVIPAHEAPIEVTNEAEVIPTHEAEVEEVISEELESVELITEPANEADVEVANEAEVIPAHEAAIEVTNEADVIPAHEASVEVANESEVIPAHEAPIEVTNEAEVIPVHEAEVEQTNEADVEIAREAQVEETREAEVAPAHEAEVEEVEVEEISREYITEPLHVQMLALFSAMQNEINAIKEEILDEPEHPLLTLEHTLDSPPIFVLGGGINMEPGEATFQISTWQDPISKFVEFTHWSVEEGSDNIVGTPDLSIRQTTITIDGNVTLKANWIDNSEFQPQ